MCFHNTVGNWECKPHRRIPCLRMNNPPLSVMQSLNHLSSIKGSLNLRKKMLNTHTHHFGSLKWYSLSNKWGFLSHQYHESWGSMTITFFSRNFSSFMMPFAVLQIQIHWYSWLSRTYCSDNPGAKGCQY